MTLGTTGRPIRVAVLGGGNGIPVVLRGLRQRRQQGDLLEITAVVAASDDGGSSGRLRADRGGLPPGDLRNCLLALADEERDGLSELFGHRFAGRGALAGHAVGNLILSALAERKGCFLQGIEAAGSLLGVCGRVLPVSVDEVSLSAETLDGVRIDGESSIGHAARLERIWLEPAGVSPTPGVVDAIAGADLVVIGPGSLFTSLLAVLLVPGVADAVRSSAGRKVLVANLMTQPGETLGYDLSGHLEVLDRHLGTGLVDEVLVNSADPGGERLQAYREQGAELLDVSNLGQRRERAVRAPLITGEGKVRHDPQRLVAALLRGTRSTSTSRSASPQAARMRH